MSTAIHDAINAIARQHNGCVTPEQVLAAARNKSSPLHAAFDWDNKSAAHQYRLDQARILIRSVRIDITTETKVVRSVFYVRDPRQAHDQTGYISITKVRTESDLAREVLIAEFSRVNGALARARTIAEVLNLGGDIDHLRDKVQGLTERVMAATPAAIMHPA